MQDIKELEDRGIPGGYVASEVFMTAARTHGEAVGFHADSVFVAHPIQDRTDDEMRALADSAFERISALICARDGG